MVVHLEGLSKRYWAKKARKGGREERYWAGRGTRLGHWRVKDKGVILGWRRGEIRALVCKRQRRDIGLEEGRIGV